MPISDKKDFAATVVYDVIPELRDELDRVESDLNDVVDQSQQRSKRKRNDK